MSRNFINLFIPVNFIMSLILKNKYTLQSHEESTLNSSSSLILSVLHYLLSCFSTIVYCFSMHYMLVKISLLNFCNWVLFDQYTLSLFKVWLLKVQAKCRLYCFSEFYLITAKRNINFTEYKLNNENNKVLVHPRNPQPWVFTASQSKFLGTGLARSRACNAAVLRVLIVVKLAW